MIHKFIANDNKGNVNVLEVTSTGTKLGKVAPPVEDTDVATKKYVDDNAAGVQEYWIPVEASGLALSIPNDKQSEVRDVLYNGNNYWVRGINMDGTYYPGYVSNHADFIVPLSKSLMQGLGFDCAGKIHIVNGENGYTVTCEPDKFIVTLTPTALDYSGTMDKTVAEMTEAYNAGMQIVWRVVMSEDQYTDVNVTAVMTDARYDYPSFNAYVIEIDSGVLVYAHIPVTNYGTTQTYSTKVYSLTPAS